MPIYSISFDRSAANQLDEFALLARQDYNFGKGNNWFSHFRGGLYGHYSRLYGVETHYENIHHWLPVPQRLHGDFSLASFFFNADSALECFVYALNALGNSVEPNLFIDLGTASNLKGIAPRNITGNETSKALAGYGKYFPSVQQEWKRQHALVKTIVDLHDVSKHRTTIQGGGMLRSDVPPGFDEMVGAKDKSIKTLWPSKEVLLRPNPKLGDPPPSRREDYETLEDVGPEFRDFINNISKLAIRDAKETIRLKETTLREPQ